MLWESWELGLEKTKKKKKKKKKKVQFFTFVEEKLDALPGGELPLKGKIKQRDECTIDYR